MQLEVDSIHRVGIVGLLVVVSACMHARVSSYICPLCLSRDRCVWSRLPTIPPTVLNIFFLYSSSVVFSPPCFFWTTRTSNVPVSEVYGSFWKGFCALRAGGRFSHREAWRAFPCECVVWGRGDAGSCLWATEAPLRWNDIQKLLFFGSDTHFLSGDITREAGSDVRFGLTWQRGDRLTAAFAHSRWHH